MAKLSKFRFLIPGLSIFLIGAGLFLLSMTYYQPASAQDSQYAQKYTVTSWRQAQGYYRYCKWDGYTGTCPEPTEVSTNWLTIGPGKWTIQGSVGDQIPACAVGETCINETWEVNDWDNDEDPSLNISPYGEGRLKFRYQLSDTATTTSRLVSAGVTCPHVMGCDDRGIYNVYGWGSGLYGGSAIIYVAESVNSGGPKQDLDARYTSGFHSWPKAWLVKGTI